MGNYDLLVTVASWEDRFVLGLQKTLDSHGIRFLYMYFYKEWEEWTAVSRNQIREMCHGRGIELYEACISFASPLSTWKTFEADLEKPGGKTVLLDITTMPRDAIWSILYFLDKAEMNVSYIYHKPATYCSDWLSRDPDRPRLLLKQSGIAKFGCKTVLLIVTGYDPDRTEQLITAFEPKITLLGFQAGSQFDNKRHNIENHKDLLERYKSSIEIFDLNAYSHDHGLQEIIPLIEKHLPNSNIVAGSLGPKPSAIALYLARKRYPDIALAYAPSKEVNKNYSSGLGDCIEGSLRSSIIP